jgi:hypothetical protein
MHTRSALLALLCLSACHAPATRDNPEIARIRDEDQADREPGQTLDWKLVGPRDAARLARVKELYLAGALQSGPDFHRAALVLQHGTAPEDFLLAHELCIAAIARGEQDALWLCAASEDRFLMNIDRPQRFATQYRSTVPGEPMRLYQVGEGVSDELRKAFHAPTLEEARKREELINSLYKKKE